MLRVVKGVACTHKGERFRPVSSDKQNSPGRMPRLSPLQTLPGFCNTLVHQLLCVTSYELTARTNLVCRSGLLCLREGMLQHVGCAHAASPRQVGQRRSSPCRVGGQKDGVATLPHGLGEAPSPSLALNVLTSKVLMTLTRDTSEGCSTKSGQYNI